MPFYIISLRYPPYPIGEKIQTMIIRASDPNSARRVASENDPKHADKWLSREHSKLNQLIDGLEDRVIYDDGID